MYGFRIANVTFLPEGASLFHPLLDQQHETDEGITNHDTEGSHECPGNTDRYGLLMVVVPEKERHGRVQIIHAQKSPQQKDAGIREVDQQCRDAHRAGQQEWR